MKFKFSSALVVLMLPLFGIVACAGPNYEPSRMAIEYSDGVQMLMDGDPDLEITDDSRVVCRHNRPLGTKIPNVYCSTVAELEAAKALDQETFGDMTSRNVCPNCGE